VKYLVTVNGVTYEVEVAAVEDQPLPAPIAAQTPLPPARVPATPPSATVTATPVAPSGNLPVGAGEKVNAPMPGTILDVILTSGATVKEGETVLILEAMKMQNEIVAPKAGRLSSVNVSKGDTVKTGQLLFAVE